MARLTLDHVTKTFDGGVEAVRDVSFEVEDGAFVVLVGPSGCGKTTTLRMIAGLETPTRGRLLFDGQVVNGVRPRHRDVALVFQDDTLYPHLRVFDNIALGLTLRRYPRGEVTARVRETAALLGLVDVLDRKPRQLSGGQRQRVALGRAIVRRPRVFLFDEPLSNLDAPLRLQLRAEIAKLHRRRRTTTVYVTHDQTEALTMGERIVVMHEGRVQQVAAPRALYDHPANRFVAGFIGSPPMNFVDGTLTGGEGLAFTAASDGLRLPLAPGGGAALEPGRPVVLGVRPEDVALVAAEDADVVLPLEMSEPLGHETVLYARNGGLLLVARAPLRVPPPPGTPIGLRLDRQRVHLFSADDGRALTNVDPG